MFITKELLKAEIDKIPEHYFDVLYLIIQALNTPLNLMNMPFQRLAEDVPTPEQVVAKIQSMPKNPANIERATESLAKKLIHSPNQPDLSFDVQNWNKQWDDIEAKMKQEALAHEEIERTI